MEEAVHMAADWGAKIVGLGSMTGIVGGQGAYLSERAPVPVTTGNSLTVYAAIENLVYACSEAGMDLAEETVAVIGIPGSIATAAARLLASRVKSLVLVARRPSPRASRVAEELGAELLLEIPEALGRARVVFSATSSGDCIDQRWLSRGSLVADVAVPTDIQGTVAQREDVLLLTGGLSKVPETMSLDSRYLWFHHGMVPSCLAETIVLGLEDRAECFSLGRNLQPQRIEEIGRLASGHGFSFSRLYSFGVPLEESVLVRYRKAIARGVVTSGNRRQQSGWGVKQQAPAPPTAERLAPRAAGLYRRYVNPVLMALIAKNGFVKTFVRGEGTQVWDAEGHAYLDFVAGYGSLNLGHNHPAVVRAVHTAMTAGSPGFSPASVNPFAAALAEQLATVSPPGLEITFFANSGTEAVEAALKLARKATGRSGLLYCRRSYHGKSLGSLSVTGNPTYQEPFGPLLPGLGRTGAMFAVDHLGVEPDVMTLAKSLGGGLVPIGAMLARRDLWLKAYGTVQSFALHTSTFGGGSLACAAGLAALEGLRPQDLPANPPARGRQLLDGLSDLCARCKVLREVRGQGLLIGLEFHSLPNSLRSQVKDLGSREITSYLIPNLEWMLDPLGALYVMNALLEKHCIYTQTTRSNPCVLRVQPPLTITAGEVTRFLKAVEDCCLEIEFCLNLVDGVVAKSSLGQHKSRPPSKQEGSPQTLFRPAR